MIAPYYEEDGIQIFCGDCCNILPSLPKADLLVTDPPYGIGRDGMRPSTSSHGGRKSYEFKGWDSEPPPPEAFEAIFAQSQHQIIWGANYFTRSLPPSMGWIFWDKGQRICGSDGELAFTSFDCALRVFTFNRVELQLDGAYHPTQKPLKLIKRCIEHADQQVGFPLIGTILDPFCGSGTTLRAAKDLGRRAIGIEISEEYCQIAVQRLRQEVLQFA
jgi:DNA modification methylase